MELNWLRYFHTVAQTKSITLASQRLRVSQPAVTKMIKQLERHYDRKLFLRNRRGVALTPEGRALYLRCVPIFHQLDGLERKSFGTSQNFNDTFRIGASDSLCHYLFPKAIARFQKKYSAVNWELFSGTSTEIKKRVLVGELDYGLFYTRMGLKERELLSDEVIGRVPFVVACSKMKSKFKTIAQLNQQKLIYIGARTQDYPTTIPEEWIYNSLGIKIDRTIQCNNKETQKKLVLEGVGFAVLPGFMVKDARSELTVFESDRTQINLLLVSRKHESVSDAFRHFLKQDFILTGV